MQQPFTILKQVLSDRKVSLVIILLVIMARAIQLVFYLDSFFDTSFQVIATQNFAAGHGISTGLVQAMDLSATIYQPQINWPPGYSLLLTPFYIACGNNYLIACFLLEILAAVSVVLLTRKILMLLDVSLAVINLFTLLTGFFIYYFHYTGSTDGISIAFFLGAICAMMAALKENRKWMTRSVIAGTCLLLGASLKYLFFPVVFTVPVFIFIYGFQNKNTVIKKAALLSFMIIGAGIAALYLYQKSISGTGAYISATGRGFFPEHLLRAHPVIPAAFLTPNSLRKLPATATGQVMDLFRVIHIILFLALLIFAGRNFFRSGLKNASVQKTFLFLALAIGLAISLVLIVLSLTVDKELIPPNRWWTYVEDARYYGLADILVHLSVFLLFFHYRQRVSKRLKLVLFMLPFLLLPEAIRGLVFTGKRVIHAGQEEYYWEKERRFFGLGARIVQQKLDSTGAKKAVVASSLYYAIYRSALQLRVPVMEDLAALLAPAQLKTSEPVVMLVIIKEEQLAAFKGFTGYPGTELAGELNGFYFYTLYVAPR